jgi:hypothetical protein
MDPLLKKLNHRPDTPVVVLGAPAEVEATLAGWASEADVRRELGGDAGFVLAFVRSRDDIAEQAPRVAASSAGDAVVWFAYPKKSSKRYRCDVTRDDGWQPLGDVGFEPVRQIAIDEDWSALRFRRSEHIATMVRPAERALSEEGRRRASPPAPRP